MSARSRERAERSLPIRQAVALAGGLAGGTVWWILGLPLPWMVGSMIGGLAVGLLPMRPTIDTRARAVMMVVIGIIVGSAVPDDFLATARGWWLSLALVGAYTFTVMAVGMALLQRLARYDPLSSFCMAAPGGFLEMVLICSSVGADPNRIALVHSVRMLVVVLFVPAVMVMSGPADVSSVPAEAGTNASGSLPGLVDLLVLTGCALGAVIGKRIKLPGALMIFPMVLTGIAYTVGLIDAALPDWALIIAQLVVGTAIGCSIALLRPATMVKALLAGLVLIMAYLTLSLIFALALSSVTDLPINLAFLLFAPGGAPEMSLIALSLGMEPAMVASHHIFRLLLVVMLAPLIARTIERKNGRRPAFEDRSAP